MIVTIMQPYFFLYIGYFKHLECSDIFVVYDDVQYIKNGWVNRNRILIEKIHLG
jgi:WbqC-like protein family